MQAVMKQMPQPAKKARTATCGGRARCNGGKLVQASLLIFGPDGDVSMPDDTLHIIKILYQIDGFEFKPPTLAPSSGVEEGC
ncbi:hypothetical protein EVAR_50097_1 [Eumeta japonica]|uniref:Uncharacterized protein n=1 Tax=Eumeta variegata TaxID=151549 RepID=A0A4C1XT98_EUMVA|nr:hypothetical protein EVAR_50097_1 [Eumeta japonica]